MVRFEFRMWGDIDFEVISAAENSNKKSVEDAVTLGPMGTCHTSVI